MSDLTPRFDTPSPIAGENLFKAELNVSEQARVQAAMEWGLHVMSNFSNPNIPPMVALLQRTPQRIEESPKYYERRSQVLKKTAAELQIEELWKQGPITSGVKLSDDLEIEPLQTNYGVVTAMFNGEPIKIVYSSDCDSANIAQTARACLKGKNAAAQFGIEETTPGHLLLVSSQLPLVDSQYTPFQNVSHVGCRGIENFEQSDELAGIAHEEGHARFDGTLQKYYKMSGSRRSEYYPWEMTLEFIDEGVAVLAQQAILNTPATAILKTNFETMHPVLKDQLRQGKYDEQWLYNYTKSKDEKSIDLVFRSDVHARFLPGAFVEYCLTKGYKLQDLMKVLFDKLDQAKPEIAKALGIEDQAVVLDHEKLLFAVMDKMEIPRTERKDHFDLEDKVYAEMERVRLTPFQIMASLEGSNEEQAIRNFLEWAER